MATKKINTDCKYKAKPRFFEWVPVESPDFLEYVEALKKGESVDLKKIKPNRLKWCLDNELIVKS